MENSETQIWIAFAFACNYINEGVKNKLEQKSDDIGRLLFHMIKNPDKYKGKS